MFPDIKVSKSSQFLFTRNLYTNPRSSPPYVNQIPFSKKYEKYRINDINLKNKKKFWKLREKKSMSSSKTKAAYIKDISIAAEISKTDSDKNILTNNLSFWNKLTEN